MFSSPPEAGSVFLLGILVETPSICIVVDVCLSCTKRKTPMPRFEFDSEVIHRMASTFLCTAIHRNGG